MAVVEVSKRAGRLNNTCWISAFLDKVRDRWVDQNREREHFEEELDVTFF